MKEERSTNLWGRYQRSRASEQKVLEVTECQVAFLRLELGQRIRHPFLERCELRDRRRVCLWFL